MASMVNVIGARFSYTPSSIKVCDQTNITSLPMRRRGVVSVRATEAINPDIRKSENKVVGVVVITEIFKPIIAYCRCWRSGTFLLCDGTHVKHNKDTGDNVGPLLLKKQYKI